MQEKAKIYALRTFKNKARTENFYVVECLLDTAIDNPNYKGLSQVTVFVDEFAYNFIKNDFKPLMPCELSVQLNGNRVNYSLIM